MCCRRRRPRQRPSYWPTDAFHKAALQHLRQKFAQSWKACGQAKTLAQTQRRNRDVDQQWARFLQHKLLQFRHHKYSQLLKILKRTRRIEGQ